MNRRLEYRVILPIFVFIVLAVIFMNALVLMDKVGGHETKLPLPDAPLPILGEEVAMRLSDLAGEPFVLNAFASWCAPCRVEHPLLAVLADRLPLYGYDWRDSEADVRLYLTRLGNPYRKVFFDERGETGVALGMTGTPETMLVDAGGMIVWRYVGALDEYVIENELLPRYRELIDEK